MSGKLIAIWSPCAGSGVTTLSTSLAAALSHGGSVLALDLNLAEPSLALRTVKPHMLHAHMDSLLPLLRGRRLSAEELEHYTTPAPGGRGFEILPGFLHPFSALQLTEGDVHALLDCALASKSLVLADLNPAVDSVGTWPVLERADRVIWVVGGSYESRYHTRRYLSLRDQIGLQPERLLLAYVANHPVSVEQVAEEIGAIPSVAIPAVPALRDQEGMLLFNRMPSAYRKAIQQLAGILEGSVRQRTKPVKPQWFGLRRDAHAQR